MLGFNKPLFFRQEHSKGDSFIQKDSKTIHDGVIA